MDKARQFYEDLFGWKDARPPAGALYVGNLAGVPDASVRYVAVESADDIASRVAPLGGTLLRKVEEVAEVGRVGVLADPLGTPLGFIQPVVKA